MSRIFYHPFSLPAEARVYLNRFAITPDGQLLVRKGDRYELALPLTPALRAARPVVSVGQLAFEMRAPSATQCGMGLLFNERQRILTPIAYDCPLPSAEHVSAAFNADRQAEIFKVARTAVILQQVAKVLQRSSNPLLEYYERLANGDAPEPGLLDLELDRLEAQLSRLPVLRAWLNEAS